MEQELSFDEIRPYRDDEVNGVLKELIADASFMQLARYFFSDYTDEHIKTRLMEMESNLQFQAKGIYPAMQQILSNSSTGFTASGFDQLEKSKTYLFISNHRDISLDPALLNYTLYEQGFDTTEIAIGNNLLTKSWIEKLARLNKSFVVHRDVQGRQSLAYSQRLSSYIRSSVVDGNSSVWIAQREGRTKDGNDRTQPSLLKMLTMTSDAGIVETIRSMKIVPVAISYENDPCDALKIWEKDPAQDDISVEYDRQMDLHNMVTGVQGQKGGIHFAAGTPIDAELDALGEVTNKNELFKRIAEIIDQQIFDNYKIFPISYYAWDKANNSAEYLDQGKYTADDAEKFQAYFEQRHETIPTPVGNLIEELYKMYGYPVANFRDPALGL